MILPFHLGHVSSHQLRSRLEQLVIILVIALFCSKCCMAGLIDSDSERYNN